MRYVLCVKQPAYGKQGGFLAYQLAKALLEKDIKLRRCFFPRRGHTWQCVPLSRE